MKKAILFSMIFLTSISWIKANFESYGISEIEYFNRREYGGATQNWSISQSKSGLLYFANNDGVIEYDGSRWRLLPNPPNLENVLPRSVYAENDRVYIGTTDEFGYYQKDSTGNFNYHSLSDQYDVPTLGEFWNILKKDNQLVFDSHEGLCIYNEGESVKVIRPASRITETFQVNNMILAHDTREGLMELRNGSLFKVPGGNVFAEKSINAIIPASNNEIIIGTLDQGLFKWDMDGIEKWDVPAGSFLEKNNIFCGTKVGNEFAFGTIQSGVVIVDEDGNIQMIANKDKGLKNNTVLDIFVDHQKNIWAALDNGIARINYNSAVTFIQGYFDIGTGYCMEKKNNNFYFGTNQGLYTITREKFEKPTKNRNDFQRIEGSNGQVWTIFEDEKSGELLIGHDLGIFHIEDEKAQPISPPSLNGAWMFRHLPGEQDKMVAGHYNGLALLERNSQNKWKFQQNISGFPESSRFIEWDEEGALWVAHGLKGIFKLRFNNDYSRVTEIKKNEDFKGLNNFKSFSLSYINGKIVFTSPHGIYSRTDNDVFSRDPLEEYFQDMDAFPVQLRQDQFDNIWYFEDNGVGVLRLQEDGTYKKIDNPLVPLRNKLVSGFESIFVLNEETAFFGTEDGFGQYSATNEINYYQPFQVHIRGFRTPEEPENQFFTNSTQKTQDYVPVYEFKENAFEVFYSATWFGNRKVEYSTILEGFENNWSPWGTIKNRQFTRLHEGTYTFKVRARNVHGVQSKPATFQFTVLPPWYRTTTAKIIYAALGIILILASIWITNRIIEKSHQRERMRQKEKYREREEQLKRQALENEKEMINLRNDKLQNDMKHKEKELANSTMHIIQKNEFLNQIKEELQKAGKLNDRNALERKIASVIKKINQDINNEEHWEIFETHLEQVHEDFLKRLTEKHPELTAKEMRLTAYLKMNMSSKEIASLMNITYRAVENNRYKLRKKLDLEQGENLVDYVMKI